MPLRVRGIVLLPGLLLFLGCGGPPMAPVTGKITCGGKPVKEAMVTFAPIAGSAEEKMPGRPASGCTNDNGVFFLSTHKPNDGALVRKHRVTVVLDDTNPARCKRESRYEMEVKEGQNELNLELTR